jgi:integrase
MRIVRLVINYVMATKKLGIEKNPVDVLNQLDSWNDLEERDTTIAPDQLGKWYQAVMSLESKKMQDFFMFLMFTGLRRNEAMRLEWLHVDTRTNTLTIPKELSKTKRTRKIPLTDVLLEVLRSRKANNEVQVGNPYVFQGRHGHGHLIEPKRSVYEVAEESGIDWSSHALRRTYVTIANKLDVSAYKVKFLVGHSVSGDVTGKHYSKLDVDDVREAAQEIADYLKDKMGMNNIIAEAVSQ